MKPHLWTIISCLIIGFLGGVGTGQMTIAKEVSSQGARIVALEKCDADLKEEIATAGMQTEKRFENVVRLLESQSRASADLTSLVREQNKLIERFYLNGMKP